MTKNIIIILQIVVSILLILSILAQVRGKGFGRVWGGSPSSFTRRGFEKLVFKLTFILTGLFAVLAILQLFV